LGGWLRRVSVPGIARECSMMHHDVAKSWQSGKTHAVALGDRGALTLRRAQLRRHHDLGRKGGKKGGKARWADVSPQERTRILRRAAEARWVMRKAFDAKAGPLRDPTALHGAKSLRARVRAPNRQRTSAT
jgi:hypothetical protein